MRQWLGEQSRWWGCPQRASGGRGGKTAGQLSTLLTIYWSNDQPSIWIVLAYNQLWRYFEITVTNSFKDSSVDILISGKGDGYWGAGLRSSCIWRTRRNAGWVPKKSYLKNFNELIFWLIGFGWKVAISRMHGGNYGILCFKEKGKTLTELIL